MAEDSVSVTRTEETVLELHSDFRVPTTGLQAYPQRRSRWSSAIAEAACVSITSVIMLERLTLIVTQIWIVM